MSDMEDDEAPRKMGKYILGQKIGVGGFSKVFLGTHEITGERVALKILEKKGLSKDQSAVKQVKRELEAMTRIQHRNVIGLKHVDWDALYPKSNGSTTECILVVLELATGGELFEFLSFTGCFEEAIARSYFHQLIDGLSYCHSQGVAHRDLKPENLLLDKNFVLKLADFGFAQAFDFAKTSSLMFTECGTPGYMAPEMAGQSGYEGTKADIWACGVILFIMLTGFPPFQKPNATDWWFHKLANNKHHLFWQAHSRSAYFSEEIKDFINKVLCTDPSRRVSLSDIKNHAWYKGPTISDPALAAELQRRKVTVDENKLREKREKERKDNAMHVDSMSNTSLDDSVVRSVGDSETMPDGPPALHPGALLNLEPVKMSQSLGQSSSPFGDSGMGGMGGMGGEEEKEAPPAYDPSTACYTRFESEESAGTILKRVQEVVGRMGATYGVNKYTVKAEMPTEFGKVVFTVQLFMNPENHQTVVEVRRRKGDALQFRSLFHQMRDAL